MRRHTGWVLAIGLASCTPAPDASDHARIDKLEARIAALEQASSSRRAEAPHLFELVIPGSGDTRRPYATEDECNQAKQQILNDAANRLAGMEAGFQGRPVYGPPPPVSCIPI